MDKMKKPPLRQGGNFKILRKVMKKKKGIYESSYEAYSLSASLWFGIPSVP